MTVAEERRAVVLGARGTLGLALCEQLPLAGWSIAAAVARSECDIRDEAALRALFERTCEVLLPTLFVGQNGKP